MAEVKREQCWVINNEVVEPRPAGALLQEQLADLHHAFIHDLEAKGILVGAGPFLDDTGQRFGTGDWASHGADGFRTLAMRGPNRPECRGLSRQYRGSRPIPSGSS